MFDVHACDHDHDQTCVVDLPTDDAGETKKVRPNFERARGTCRWCHAPKSERRSTADFCSDKCRTDFHNQSKKDGATIVHVAKRWRRYKRKGDFALLSQLIDNLVREDKDAGRNFYPDPPVHLTAKTVGRNIQGYRRQR